MNSIQEITNDVKSALLPFNPKFNVALAPYSTWQIGGPAEILIESPDSKNLEKLLKLATQLKLPITILGKASNVLISDTGIRGLVIINRSRHAEIFKSQANLEKNPEIAPRHTHNDTSIYDFSDLDYVEPETLPTSLVKFDSGMDLSYAIAWSLKNDLTGLQFFGGIPGTIGGALYNNIHGGTKHFSDNFVSCTTLKKLATKAKIITFCGPGGVGKNTIIRRLIADNPTLIRFTTTTTRPKRDYEKEGDDYNFVTVENFQAKVAAGEMVEYNELFPGVFYGTDKAKIQELLNSGKTIIFDIDYHGADALKKQFGEDVLSIFILPPSVEELKRRMESRGDSQIKIEERMKISHHELTIAETFDYTIINDSLEQAIQEINHIVQAPLRLQKKIYNFEDMSFGYDQSLLRKNSDIFVLDVTLKLKSGDFSKAKYVANEWAKRKRTQPRISCGSVFQSIPAADKERLNLPSQAAGYIIDKIFGLKGYTVGGVQVSPFHGNFIVNTGGGTAKDVMMIINLIRQRAKDELQLDLHPEINFLGEFEE